MGKGSGSNTTTTSSQAPQWLQNNLQSLYSTAQNVTGQPLNQYQGPLVAGFNPTQNAAMNTVNSAQGISVPFTNTAAQYIAAGTAPVMDSVQQFSPTAVSMYQDPYTQQVVNSTMAQLNQNDAIQQEQLLGRAIQSGASPFGGDRAGIAAATLAGQQDLANNQTIAGLYNQGYSQAVGELNNQQQLQLSGTTANDWLQQGAAAQEAGLGTTAQNNALSGASAQLQMGGLGQQLAQEQLNIPYEMYAQQQAYPYQNLTALEQAAGIAGGLAGGTSSTTSPGPSTLSQLGGLGLAGLGIYGAFFNKGGRVPHRGLGGSITLPNVPDVSLSFMPSSPSGIAAHSSIPNAPQASGSPSASPLAGIGGISGLKNISQGVDSLGSPNIGKKIIGWLNGGTPADMAMAGAETMPENMQQLENGAMPDTDFNSFLDSLGLGGGGMAKGGAITEEPDMDAPGLPYRTGDSDNEPDMDAPGLHYPKAKAAVSRYQDNEPDMFPLPIKRAAAGVVSGNVPYLSQGGYGMNYNGFNGNAGLGGSSGFNIGSLIQLLNGVGLGGNGSTYRTSNPTGPAIPQINQFALNGQNTTPQNYSNPLPQISNSAATYTPQSITNPAVFQGYNASGGWNGAGQNVTSGGPSASNNAPSSPSASITGPAVAPVPGTSLGSIPSVNPTSAQPATSGKTMVPTFKDTSGQQQYSALPSGYSFNGKYVTDSSGQLVGQAGSLAVKNLLGQFKSGGIAHYDDGGVTSDPEQEEMQGANPNLKNYYQQLIILPQEKLQEMAIRIPPTTQQGKMVQAALQSKRMNPTQGLGATPTVPQAPAAGTLGLASGGMAHYATDGMVQPADESNDAEDFLTTIAKAIPKSPDGGADNQVRDYAANPSTGIVPATIEAQKDPDTHVDHSGDTVVVRHPSNGESIDLGIPSQKDEKFRTYEPLIAAGLGMMAGTSPFAAVNIGRGGLEGLKTYGENRTANREEAQQKAQQAYQTGQLGMREKEIEQQGEYQRGELALRGAELAQNNIAMIPDGMGGFIQYDKRHPDNIKRIPPASMAGGTGVPSVDPETGDIIPGTAGQFGFPATSVPPKVFNAMVNEDSKRKQAENNNTPIANNVLRILDQLEPNFKNFQTGSAAPGTRAAWGKFWGTDSGTAAANIEKGTNDLATELGKFQYMPGMRGSVLGLQTILASKPGIQQPQQTNNNIMNGLRAKVTDYQLSSELNEQYREASPYKITDHNAVKLDNALKTIYPIEQVDPKTGITVFNKQNAQKIREAIPEAIANPKKYFDMARSGSGGESTGASSAAPPLPGLPKGVPAGSQYSPSRHMWRDSSGKMYDSSGNPL